MFPACARFQQPFPQFVVILLSACIFAGASVGYSQSGATDPTGTGGRHSIRGRLVFPSGQRADIRLKVRLENYGAGDLTVISDLNGNFGFQSLRPGTYTVVVEGDDNFEAERESVVIEPAAVSTRRGSATLPISRPFAVQIYLRSKNAPTAAKTGVINAALATAPKRAADLYLRALDSASKGDSERAILELRQALEIHPTFALALTELGAQYLKRKQPEKAVESLRASLKIEPDDFTARLNYGIALLDLKRIAEAEVELRTAANKNYNSWPAHMYLGVSLIGLNRYDEAEQELLVAITVGGPRVGLPRFYLGGIYWRRREYQRAASELEKYLESAPNAPNAAKVRETIKELRAKG